MSSEPAVRPGILKTLWARKWRVIVPALIGAGAAAIVNAVWPVRYVAQTTLAAVPSRIGPDYVRPAVTTPLDERVQTIRARIMTRTRLERLISELNLYADERRAGSIMEDLVDGFRKNVDLEIVDGAGTFRLSFTGSEARTTMKVAERLSAQFVDESMSHHSLRSESAAAFIESQIENAGKRLNQFESKMRAAGGTRAPSTAIEFDVLREHYRSLVQKREDLRLAADLDARALGETFKLVDPPIYPERPQRPSRTMVNLMGVGAGLMMGLVLVAAAPRGTRRAPEVRPHAENAGITLHAENAENAESSK